MATLFEFLFCLMIAIALRRYFYCDDKPATLDYGKDYKNMLSEYNTKKNEYIQKCNNTQKHAIHDYIHDGCGVSKYANGYTYESYWENNTENGFGMYIDYDDNVLVSGNKIKGHYDGLIKIHVENFGNSDLRSFHCLFEYGIHQNCYVEYDDNITYFVSNDNLEKLHLTNILVYI
jgi:hypothetical protein